MSLRPAIPSPCPPLPAVPVRWLVAHLGQLEAAPTLSCHRRTLRAALAQSSYGGAAPVDFLRRQSQLLRSGAPSQVEREGPGTPPTTLARGKAQEHQPQAGQRESEAPAPGWA